MMGIVTNMLSRTLLNHALLKPSSLVQKPGNGKKRFVYIRIYIYIYYPWVVVFHAAAISPATYRLLSYFSGY